MRLKLTSIARPFMRLHHERMLRWLDTPEATQRRVLARLLHRARATEIGQKYGFGTMDSYGRFAQAVPLAGYEDIRPYVMRMVAGERDVLWPGRVTRFAQSSGTSGGASKYIPVTADGMARCHYAGPKDIVARYLHHYPDSRLFDGKTFILGGSFATELQLPDKRVRVGDLSAHLITEINPLVGMRRVPSAATALMADWQAKLPRLVEESAKADVTNISGVPSWFMVVLERLLERQGAATVHDVWPNLEVFFHGGINFAPYRARYEAITDPGRMRFMDTYNASEGFFAMQFEPDKPDQLLLLNNDTFYEFIPVEEVDSPAPTILTCGQLTAGQVYALVITNSNGLWRYKLGDTVRVTSTDPLKIVIAGRTKAFINAFGEELMVCNAEAAMAAVCGRMHCSVADYTAAPVFAAGHKRGRHEWLVEFSTPPQDLDAFATALDDELQRLNSDYKAKRSHSIFLDRLTVVSVPRGSFDAWLAAHGRKLGGQRKIPRLANDRSIADPILDYIHTHQP